MIAGIIRNVSRYLIGIVFIFSGFVKAIDPWGSAFKFSDYLEAFGIDFLLPFTLILAILLSTAELLIGLTLFLKLRMRVTSWALLIFMIFFTCLTFFSALTNPVTDCGCFGDALILTNWQTFFKNIVFLIPTIIVFYQRNKFIPTFHPIAEWSVTAVLTTSIVLLSVYCIRNLPLYDFLPYKAGANIPELMVVPEGVPVDQYETLLIYEKDGVKEEFTLDSPEKPWSDSTWTWVETINKLVKKGYVPPIHDFSLVSQENVDITDDVLTDTGYSFLIVCYNLTKSNTRGLDVMNDFAERAVNEGYKVYGMTSTTKKIIDTMGPFNFEFYTTDDITLKTMIRSNPGILLIRGGVVLGKWHWRNLPELDEMNQFGALSYSIDTILKARSNNLTLVWVLLLGFISMIIFHIRYLVSEKE